MRETVALGPVNVDSISYVLMTNDQMGVSTDEDVKSYEQGRVGKPVNDYVIVIDHNDPDEPELFELPMEDSTPEEVLDQVRTIRKNHPTWKVVKIRTGKANW